MSGRERRYYSRSQVLREGEPAWTMDEREVVYYFDGLCFRRRGRKGEPYALVAPWRSPARGWMHLPDCPCEACAPDGAQDVAGGREVA